MTAGRVGSSRNVPKRTARALSQCARTVSLIRHLDLTASAVAPKSSSHTSYLAFLDVDTSRAQYPAHAHHPAATLSIARTVTRTSGATDVKRTTYVRLTLYGPHGDPNVGLLILTPPTWGDSQSEAQIRPSISDIFQQRPHWCGDLDRRSSPPLHGFQNISASTGAVEQLGHPRQTYQLTFPSTTTAATTTPANCWRSVDRSREH